MTFGKPIRKTAGITAKRRAAKRRRLVREERANKTEARRRDGALYRQPAGWCRFPLCGCHGKGLFVEVSHYAQHKGMGGDPTGERSAPEHLICLCNWRHKDGYVSIDKHRLRPVPLTPAGANGPVAWEVDREYIDGQAGQWIEVAREVAVQVLAPILPTQLAVLERLAEMKQ